MNPVKVLSISLLMIFAIIVLFSIYISVTIDGQSHEMIRNADLYNSKNGDFFIVCDGVLTTLDTTNVPDGHTLRKDSTHKCGWSFAA